jgi:uncharacterized protein with PIN domain
MRFIVDCMLGKLARWLKVLGFDVLFFPRIDDGELLAIAQKENRTLLSRDTALVQKANGVKSLLVSSEKWNKQVREVLDKFDLWGKVSPYTRCLECNSPLRVISREAARKLVPPFVCEHASRFSLCPCCGRVYWQGTHYKDMKDKIEEILKNPKPAHGS